MGFLTCSCTLTAFIHKDGALIKLLPTTARRGFHKAAPETAIHEGWGFDPAAPETAIHEGWGFHRAAPVKQLSSTQGWGFDLAAPETASNPHKD